MTQPESRRDTRVRVGVLAIVLLGAVLGVLAVGDSIPWHLLSSATPPRVRPAAAPTKVTIAPERIDFGFHSYCERPELLSQQVTITNTGVSLASVVHWSASCGCTTSDLPETFELTPGGSRVFTASVDPWGAWGRKSQSIQFIVDEAEVGTHPGPRVVLEVEVGGPLHPAPGLLRRPPADAQEVFEGEMESKPWERGEGLIVSEDGLPFRITAVNVPCVRLTEQGPPPQWNFEFEWSELDAWAKDQDGGIVEYDDGGRWTRVILVFSTDRADCPSLHVAVLNNAGPYVRPARAPMPRLGVPSPATAEVVDGPSGGDVPRAAGDSPDGRDSSTTP